MRKNIEQLKEQIIYVVNKTETVTSATTGIIDSKVISLFKNIFYFYN